MVWELLLESHDVCYYYLRRGWWRSRMSERLVRQCPACQRAFAESAGSGPRCPTCGNPDTTVVAREQTMAAALERARQLAHADHAA